MAQCAESLYRQVVVYISTLVYLESRRGPLDLVYLDATCARTLFSRSLFIAILCTTHATQFGQATNESVAKLIFVCIQRR
jgi:hypothetical protein